MDLTEPASIKPVSVMSKRTYQRQIPLFIVSVVGAIFIAEYFTGNPEAKVASPLTPLTAELSLWGTIIYAFTLLFGYVGLLRYQARRVQQRKTTRLAVLGGTCIGAATIFTILGIVSPGGITGSQYQLWYTYIVAYAGGGMYTAWVHHPYNSYRYFRLTSIESATMFLCWILICLRELSMFVAIWEPFYAIGTWVEGVPNTAVQRAALAAYGVGAIVLALRALVWKEPGLVEMEMA
jgi:hypothetical protein